MVGLAILPLCLIFFIFLKFLLRHVFCNVMVNINLIPSSRGLPSHTWNCEVPWIFVHGLEFYFGFTTFNTLPMCVIQVFVTRCFYGLARNILLVVSHEQYARLLSWTPADAVEEQDLPVPPSIVPPGFSIPPVTSGWPPGYLLPPAMPPIVGPILDEVFGSSLQPAKLVEVREDIGIRSNITRFAVAMCDV